MKRRSFIARISGIAAAVAGALALGGILKQFYPRSTGRRSIRKVGKLYEYPVDTFTFVDDLDLFIYRDHEGVRAVSAVCTHLGCILQKSTDGFICPCHGSCYNTRGDVLSGPAPRNLSWFEVSRGEDDRLIIDTGKAVDPGYKFIIS